MRCYGLLRGALQTRNPKLRNPEADSLGLGEIWAMLGFGELGLATLARSPCSHEQPRVEGSGFRVSG